MRDDRRTGDRATPTNWSVEVIGPAKVIPIGAHLRNQLRISLIHW